METTIHEIQRIDEQLERAFRAGAWSGPTVLETLEGVSAKVAADRPIEGAHSIWEIALHIGVWKRVVTRRLAGDAVLELEDDEDWPPVHDPSASAWRQARADLEAAHEQLRKAVRKLRDDQLDDPPARGASKRYVLIHGVIQHDLYHAGQIALLKRA